MKSSAFSKIILLLLPALFLIACAAEMTLEESYDEAGMADFAAMEEAPAAANTSIVAYDSRTAQTVLQETQQQERLIIRTGGLDLVVADTEETQAEIGRLAVLMDGWVVNSNIYQLGEGKAGNITVRVPAAQFDRAVEQFKALALEVTSESTDSQDVTEEYVDLEARLANLEATADRVRAFLDEARNVEEALAVNQELSRLEAEIESLKGRIKYLSQSAAFSTISVSLIPDELSQPIEVAGWRPEGVAKDAIETLISAVQAIANVAIWGFIFCLPLGLLIGLPAYFLGRAGYRRWRRRRAPAGADSPSLPAEDDTAAADKMTAGEAPSEDSPRE